MAEIVDLGASGLDERTGAIWVQCKSAPVGEEDAPDFGKSPMMCALGFAARPAPATQAGSAQGVVVPVDGFDGVCVAAHDPRAAKTYGEIGLGESGMFATGEGFEARVLCKDGRVASIVDDDIVFQLIREDKQIVANTPGGTIKISEKDGIVLMAPNGTTGIQISGDTVVITGQVVLGGRTPSFAVAQVPPIVGLPTTGPGVPVPPARGVFIGAMAFLLTLLLLLMES